MRRIATPPLFALLALAGAVFSLVLILRDRGSSIGHGLCKIGAQFDCAAVVGSEWATLFGTSLSVLGLFFYLAIFFFSFATFSYPDRLKAIYSDVMIVVSGVAVLFSVYLFIVSKFILGAFCPFCVGMYVVNFGLFGFSLLAGGSLISGVRVLLAFIPASFAVWFKGPVERRTALNVLLVTATVFGLTLRGPLLVERFYLKQAPANVKKSFNIPINFSPGVDQDFYKGKASTSVKVVEYFDIECPFCRQFYFDMQPLVKEFSERATFVFKNYPLDHSCNSSIPQEMHLHACFAANLVRCASEQDSYWEVLSLVLSSVTLEEELAPAEAQKRLYAELENDLSLDVGAIQSCVASGRHLPKIRSDIQEADELGLEGTPSIWVNNKYVKNLSIATLRAAIERELKRTS